MGFTESKTSWRRESRGARGKSGRLLVTVYLSLKIAHIRCLQEVSLLDEDDRDQSVAASVDLDYVSEDEVSHELEQPRHFARTVCSSMRGTLDSTKVTRIQVISSDPGSEWDYPNVSEREDKSRTDGRTPGGADDRSKRDTKRPPQAFVSPLAKFDQRSPAAPKESSQVCVFALDLSLLPFSDSQSTARRSTHR